MKNTTHIFLVKKSGDKIVEICLAMKKRGFGVGRWNAVGGKVMEGESIEEGALREAQEEIGVLAKNISKVAEHSFNFPHKPDWNQTVHTFVSIEWEGEPTESEEMNPKWFAVSDIPYSEMWPDDIFWLPHIIEGKLLKTKFVFGENDLLLEKQVDIVDLL